jgi:hypothetical protein
MVHGEAIRIWQVRKVRIASRHRVISVLQLVSYVVRKNQTRDSGHRALKENLLRSSMRPFLGHAKLAEVAETHARVMEGER